MEPLRITREEAIAALTAAAFTVTDPEDQNYGRTLTHCMMSFTGADWDLSAAIEKIQQTDVGGVAWVKDMFGHELSVLVDGRAYRFDVKRPDTAGAQWP